LKHLALNINIIYVQWNLCNPTPEFSDILWHPTKIYGPKVFLLTKTKPKYSDFLYNPTLFPGPLVCRNKQVPLYLNLMKIRCLLYLINYVFFFGDTLNHQELLSDLSIYLTVLHMIGRSKMNQWLNDMTPNRMLLDVKSITKEKNIINKIQQTSNFH
jgi:hypothetical protein